MATDIEIYCNCMSQVRHRLSVVQHVLDGTVKTGHATFDAELIFVQLRKTLELIAFGSLSANRTRYAQVHENFASHWKAVKLLDALRKINPEFYPRPLNAPQRTGEGTWQFSEPADGFLTEPQFVSLYDASSEVLHTRNPFKVGDPTIHIGVGVPEWVSRIQRLLSWHRVHLAGRDVWVVNIPAEGDVKAWPASPTR